MTDPHRLSPTAAARHYRVRLAPDLDAETFAGLVEIDVQVPESTPSIVLNNDGLTITSATVNGAPIETSTDGETQRTELAGPFEPGDHTITMEFEGEFNDQLVGFYLSRFADEDGNEHKLATTQFEATHARKAFPCWDEPAHKATFDIELLIADGHDAVANSAEISRERQEDGRTLVRFATTMKMSTYLVAFVVGPLEITEPVDVDGTPLRIVHVPGKDPKLTEFALDCGAFALRYFSDYFGIGYPGDKVDLIAIPDFAFGAMENLGCITFREVLLLVDADAATQPELQRVADVINHELAHMWFGDLVTMKWWNGLWLNEAFATFMEMRCTDAYRPEWQRWVDFGISRSAAFDTDSLATTRPIEFEVHSPEEAEGMFDILTYEKGAAVVRMLEQYLGEDRFRAGIRRYMRQHAYGNAETTDLWDAIEAEVATGPEAVPVRQMMETWIFQGGFPLISAELAPNGRSVTFSQQRFGYVGGDPSDEQTWLVPLRYRWKPVDGAPITDSILIDSESVEIELPAQAEWLVANAEGASFLRVSYPDETREQLALVALEALAPVERYALVDDAWAAVLADEMTANSFLALLEMLTGEFDRSVWVRMISGFGSLDRLLDDDTRTTFESIVHDALAPALAGLTLSPQEDDNDRARQLRGDLIRAMGTLARDHEIQEEAARTVAEGRRDPELVEASIMAAAVDVVASFGDEADHTDFWNASLAASSPQETLRYLHALADFPDDELVDVMRQRILEGEVRSQDGPLWLRRALASRACGRSTWTFIQENWEKLNELFPSSSIVRMVASLTTMVEPGDSAALAEFFDANPVPQGAQTLAQILERQRVNEALQAREAARFRAILDT